MDLFNTSNTINLYGLIFAVIMLVPEIVYMKTRKINREAFQNKSMLYIDRIGKYGSLFLMAVNVGVLEKGFTSKLMESFWLWSTCALCAVSVLLWVWCFKRLSRLPAYLLTAVNTLIFVMSGLLQIKTLLLTAGVVYLLGRLYVVKNYLNFSKK